MSRFVWFILGTIFGAILLVAAGAGIVALIYNTTIGQYEEMMDLVEESELTLSDDEILALASDSAFVQRLFEYDLHTAIAQAVIQEHELPVLSGDYAAVADALAIYTLTTTNADQGGNILASKVQALLNAYEPDDDLLTPEPSYIYEMQAMQAYRIACLGHGALADGFGKLVGYLELSRAERRACALQGAETMQVWAKTLDGIGLDRSTPPINAPIGIEAESDHPFADLINTQPFDSARVTAARFAWKTTPNIQLEKCSDTTVGWRPETSSFVVCDKLFRRYAAFHQQSEYWN